MGRRQSHRSKPKKRPNRYNPNAPDYQAVHSPLPRLSGLIDPAMSMISMLLSRPRKR